MICRERTTSEQRAHLAAIEKIVICWQDGEISLAEKRERIARENAFYHGQVARGRTGMVITAPPGGRARERGDSGGHWWQDS